MVLPDYIIYQKALLLEEIVSPVLQYARLCPEYQQVTLKEPQYIYLHLPIQQFPMSFTSMDLLGPYCKTEKGDQYGLTLVCMLTNYVFMIPNRSKSIEEVTTAYLMDVYYKFGGSQYILSDKGGEITSKQFTWLANELGFIKVYTFLPNTFSNRMVQCFSEGMPEKTYLQPQHRLV